MTDSSKNYSSPLVDIVIVNWNSSKLLMDCIHSIITIRNINYINKIFIIDNNSHDDSLRHLPPHTKIHIIKNDENLGFGKAANQGFARSVSEYVLLLNPDAVLFEDTIPQSINFMTKNAQIDIMGCQLLDKDGNVSASCSRFPTPISLCAEAIGLNKIAPSLLKLSLLMVEWDHQSSKYVDQVMGAFMFIRRKIFTEIGYFDERFFVYFEDLDFSKRAADHGIKSFFNAEIRAIHIGKGTTAQVKALRLAFLLRSKLLYSKKHFSRFGHLLVAVITCSVEPFSRITYFSITGNFADARETMKGFSMFFRGIRNRN